MTKLKIMLAVVAALALAATFAAGRSSPPAVTSAPDAAGFDQQWRAAVTDVALKSASLKSAEPKPVATGRIVPDAPAIAAPVITAPIVAAVSIKADRPSAAPRRKRHVERAARHRNICTRHHMRKVYTHGGRSWRCRR